MKTLIFLLFLVFSISCKPSYYCKRCPIKTKDSISIIIKDSIVERIDTAYVSDSTSMKLFIKCDSLGNAYIQQIGYLQRNPKIEIKYKTIGNLLNVDCIVDSLSIYNKLKHIYHTEINSNVSVKEKPAEKYIPRFLIWLVIGSLLLNVIFLLWKLIKSKILF